MRGRFQQESRITTKYRSLGLGRFRTVEFPVPPLEVQNQVVASTRHALDAVDRQVDQIDREIAAIRSLRRSVLAAGVLRAVGAAGSRGRAGIGGFSGASPRRGAAEPARQRSRA